MKKFVCASLSATLLLTVTSPAFAGDRSRDFGFQGAFAPQDDAATATIDYRVPFGGRKAGKADWGLGLKYGSRSPEAASRPDVKLADFRFSDAGMQTARVGGYDFAQRNAAIEGDRLSMMEGKDSTTWIIIGLVVAGAVVWAVSQDDDDED